LFGVGVEVKVGCAVSVIVTVGVCVGGRDVFVAGTGISGVDVRIGSDCGFAQPTITRIQINKNSTLRYTLIVTPLTLTINE